MTDYTRILDERTVTVETLADDRAACRALDQARELVPGCKTWGILYGGGQRGQMTQWPNGRGAIMMGGDSLWGAWIDVGARGEHGVEILATDDLEGWYDDNGEPVCRHGYSLRPEADRACACLG